MLADDYVSEADTLCEIYDGCDDEFEDENGNYCLTCRDTGYLFGGYAAHKRSSKKRCKTMHATRCGKLSDEIESKRSTNKEASVGSDCTCPMCKRTFWKISYQMTFCSSKCRMKYNNSRFWY